MAAAVNASRSGDLLNDRYELSDLVETCDTHQLYTARDTRDDRVVHIAMLRPEVALRAGVAQRFVRAPKQVAQLDHPNVMRVWSVESDVTGIPFVVEEPRSGRTLASMIEAFPDGMPLGVAMNLLVPIVEATAAAHGRGLVHGALDPKHVLLAEHGGTTVPKVFGFGANDKASKASDDVHALGALFYRALSGQTAFDKRRAPLDELAPHLPLELTELIERCLASADERPADARLLCDELTPLRQKLGGYRTSAVSVERVVLKDSPVPAPAAAPPRSAKPASPPAAKPVPAQKPDATQERRRVLMERAETAPMSAPPPAAPAIDPVAATCFDAAKPSAEPEAEPAAAPAPAASALHAAKAHASPAPQPALEKSSIDFPMASSPPAAVQPSAPLSAAPAKPSKAQVEMATEVDDPASTRESRGKGKPKAPSPQLTHKQDKPDIAVAGPARLAAAFSPLEGGPSIEQGETQEAALGRAFRQAQDEEQRARDARFGRMQALSAAAKEVSAAQAKSVTGGTAHANAAQPHKNVQRDPARPTAAEVIALGQLHAQEEAKRERRSRFFGGFLLMLFSIALARFVPALVGNKDTAAALLGAHVKTGMAVFTALSVVVLIQTWALQIQTKSMLLKPVTYTLKVVVACSAVLAAGFFMAEGSSLGVVGAAARRFLPWASAGFFLFLGFYGMMRGLRETQVNAVAGIAMTLAYGASFAGSYSITANVIAPGMRRASQAAIAMQALAQQQGGGEGEVSPEEVLQAAGVDPELGAEITEQATTEDGFKQVRESGSGNSDVESIEEIGAARKRNSAKLGDLSGKLKELAK